MAEVIGRQTLGQQVQAWAGQLRDFPLPGGVE